MEEPGPYVWNIEYIALDSTIIIWYQNCVF